MHHSSSSHPRHSASQQTIYQTSTLNAKRFACRRFINPHSGRNIPEYFKSKTTVVCTILQFNAAVIFHRHVFKSAARLLVQIVQQINDSTAGTGASWERLPHLAKADSVNRSNAHCSPDNVAQGHWQQVGCQECCKRHLHGERSSHQFSSVYNYIPSSAPKKLQQVPHSSGTLSWRCHTEDARASQGQLSLTG